MNITFTTGSHRNTIMKQPFSHLCVFSPQATTDKYDSMETIFVAH